MSLILPDPYEVHHKIDNKNYKDEDIDDDEDDEDLKEATKT